MTITRQAQAWTLALTAAAALMVALDALVVATALNTMRRDLHASLPTLEWTVNAYSLSFAVLLMTGAALGDRFGRRRMFLAGIGGFALASAACALAPDAHWLIAARAVQGAGSALVMPLAMALLAGAFPPERRGAAMGIFTALTGLAVVGGPLVGGLIAQDLAWQWIFWVNVPIACVVIPLVLTKVSESRGPRQRIDGVGVVLATGGVLGVVWGLIRATSIGWSAPEVVGTMALGGVVLVGFVVWERRAEQPMLPMRLFASRGFAGGNAAAFLLYGALYGSVFYLAQYLQVALGYGPIAAGARFLPWSGLMFVVAPAAGRMTDRLGARPLIVTGMALQGVGMAWIAFNAGADRAYPASVAALMISGVGCCMAMPAVQSVVVNSVRPAETGKASGVFNTLRNLGGVFGVAILTAVFSAHGSYRSSDAFASGAAAALGTAAVLAGVGAVIALVIPRRPTVMPLRPADPTPSFLSEDVAAPAAKDPARVG